MANPDTIVRLNKFIQSDKFKILKPEQQSSIKGLSERIRISETLPGADKVSAMQAERVPASERLKEETRIPFTGNIGQKLLKGAVTGLKGIAVPFERIESAAAAPIERLQDPESLFAESIKRKEPAIKTLGREALKGLKGEKVVELGDIPRRAGFPEPISSFIGFGSSVALFDSVLGSPIKAIGISLGKAGRALTGFKKGTEVLKPSKFSGVLDDITKAIDKADDLRKTLGKNISNQIKKSNVKFKQEIVDDIISSIPEKFKSAVFDNDVIKSLELGIKKIGGGVKKVANPKTGIIETVKVPSRITIDPTADNVWKLGRAIKNAMSVKALKETASDIVTGKAKSAVTATRKLLNQLPKEAQNSLDDFSRFVGNFGKVERSIRGTSGIIKEKGIRGLEAGKTEEGIRLAFKELSEFLPEIRDIVAKSTNIARKQLITKAGKGVAKTAATIGLLRGAFRGVGRGGDNISGGEQPK